MMGDKTRYTNTCNGCDKPLEARFNINGDVRCSDCRPSPLNSAPERIVRSTTEGER